MSKNLVIVESPAKAKTIEKYLGSDFTVLSSVGHIRSIAKKTKSGTPPIDIKNGYKTTYEVDSDKTKIIAGLKKAVKAADTVWLATDEDREGEAIAWHLTEVLKLDPKTTNRIVFHEITKTAIEEAIKHPRTIDMDLIRAQQARQILDRLVGFELSPVVWRKVPGGKSAGRVQSPAVRLLVEREREIEKFNGSSAFKIKAKFDHKNGIIEAELASRPKTELEAHSVLENLIKSDFTVSDIATSPISRNPAAPFTTSTLQQEANARLGFSTKATMSCAQKLYQEGKITYMRTDSVVLSHQALAMTADFIKKTYGDSYSQVRNFKTKSLGAQEAHEAIRPTNIADQKVSSNEYDQKLYDLIRRRTLASQMTSAKLEKTVISINFLLPDGLTKSSAERLKSKTSDMTLEAKGEVVIFDGFLKVYGNSQKDVVVLPSVTSGDILKLASAEAHQVFVRPPARYSEGSLVKKMEELGIGRPSTYATIINTIQIRDYAKKGESEGTPRDVIVLQYQSDNHEKSDIDRKIVQEKTGSDRGKLVPTPTGEVISDFLVNHFEPIVNYDFTAKTEAGLDKIAAGALARNVMLDDFYKPFHTLIEESGGIDRSSVAQARQIGLDPKGQPIFARFGRFGPMIQRGSTDDEGNKPQFAPMPAGRKINTVTLEEALHALELPRIVGETPTGAIIKANVGRFGPYIQVDKTFVSIKPYDPYTISLAEAIELYSAKLKADSEKNIADFGDGLKILNGRYGAYVTDGTKNVKIQKDIDPKSLTKDQAQAMIEAAPASKKRRVVKRSPKKKRSTK
jgi:DNA topoisomerase-1